MAKLVKIQSELFPKLYDAFLKDDDPLSDEKDWRNIFDYQWQKEEDHTGYALLHDDQVIGMMAMAFSTRSIEGREQKFCNLHTWWVHPDHRGRSVMMLRPVMQLKDYTVTHFTPCDRIRGLTRRMGFVDLNLQLKVLLPLQILGRGRIDTSSFIFDDDQIAERISGTDRRLLVDHRPFRAGNLLVPDGNQHCYILYTHVVRFRFDYCHIHYVSNREVFAKRENEIRAALMTRHRVRAVLVDCRLFEGMKFRRSFNFWAPAHAVFKPIAGVGPAQVDNLYSDVVMLRLSILPHLSHEMKVLADRWSPLGRSKRNSP